MGKDCNPPEGCVQLSDDKLTTFHHVELFDTLEKSEKTTKYRKFNNIRTNNFFYKNELQLQNFAFNPFASGNFTKKRILKLVSGFPVTAWL